MQRPNVTMTTQDARRIEALLQGPVGSVSAMADLLEQELSRARLVDSSEVAPDVVTMNSRVVCEDADSGERHEVELVYPHQADAAQGRISVLAPVGAALLGLSVGSEIDWPVPGGRTTRVRVLAVTFQPEAAGLTA